MVIVSSAEFQTIYSIHFGQYFQSYSDPDLYQNNDSNLNPDWFKSFKSVPENKFQELIHEMREIVLYQESTIREVRINCEMFF